MFKKLLILVVLLFVSIPVFAQSVDTVWVRRYNGPGNINDKPVSIAVDKSGNVYVTGSSEGSESNMDYATIKYHPNGDTAWVRRYNGTGNYVDWARAMAIDDSGYVYVTGQIWVFSWEDYATIKYKPNGDTAWVREYDGPGNYTDGASNLAVDKSGNVYVTGGSWGAGSYLDYATIKYDPNGNTAWVKRWTSPGERQDYAQTIAVDTSGKVYVTGDYYNGDTAQDDYCTIKYDTDGYRLWTTYYDTPADIFKIDYAKDMVVDDSGNVYVTGMSGATVGGNYDWATIKYYPDGVTAWTTRFNGPGNDTDEPGDLKVDNAGNVYVAGYLMWTEPSSRYATMKYNPNGDTVWLRTKGGGYYGNGANALEVDDHGNVYVTGTCWNDYLTVKYDKCGNQVWTILYDGGHGTDGATAITVDDSGYVYVTGYSMGDGTSLDYVTIKYKQATFTFLCGDANRDEQVSVSDVIYLINYLFKGGPPPDPILSVDVNGDCKLTVSDVVYLINYLFKGGPPPAC